MNLYASREKQTEGKNPPRSEWGPKSFKKRFEALFDKTSNNFIQESFRSLFAYFFAAAA